MTSKNTTTASSKVVPLRSLLNATQNGNRLDVKVYCGGHLNPRFLCKLPTQSDNDRWSQKSKQGNSSRNQRGKEVESASRLKNRRSTIRQKLLFMKESKLKETPESKEDESSGNDEKKKKKEFKESQILHEEMKLPEVMMPRINSNLQVPPSLQADSINDLLRRYFERQKFVTTHLAGVTSKDQYHKMIHFDRTFMKRNEISELRSGVGFKSVRHLEEKLIHGLFSLQQNDKGAAETNFNKLHLYATVWSDFTQDSFLFGELLSEIKAEYDYHLSTLVEMTKIANHGELLRSYQLIGDLSKGGRAEDGEKIRLEVEVLAQKCQDALLRNADLHVELEKQYQVERENVIESAKFDELLRWSFSFWRTSILKKKLGKQGIQEKIALNLNKEQRIKILRKTLRQDMDTLEEEKKSLLTKCVSRNLLRHLNRAEKDIECEIHKLQQEINITCVLNLEKKKKINLLIECSKDANPIYFSKVEKLVEAIDIEEEPIFAGETKMDMDEQVASDYALLTNATTMRKSLYRPDLLADFFKAQTN